MKGARPLVGLACYVTQGVAIGQAPHGGPLTTDTLTGAFPYSELRLDEDPFAVIARAALASGIGVRGHVGQAESHLFPAPELTAFAVSWLEDRFSAGGGDHGASEEQ